MPDIVIDRVNLLGNHQQQILVFTDNKGRLIGDDDIDLTGVGGDGDKNKAPLKIKN